MRTHTDNHMVAAAATPVNETPCVNQVTAPAACAGLSIKPAGAERPRVLARRGARWARRASHWS